MNDLTIRETNLPAMPMEEVKQYVDIIGDAIDALKAKRNAAGHLNADKSVIDEMDAQIREYSAMKLKAEIELGKKTAEIEKTPRITNLKPERSGAPLGKFEQLESMGIHPRSASDYERLARHESIVTEYIEHQLEKGETPTKSGAFKRISEELPKPKDLKQMAQGKLDELKEKDVITLDEVREVKHSEEIVRTEENDEFFRDVMAARDKLFLYTGRWESKSRAFWQTASIADRMTVGGTLASISESAVKILDQAAESLQRKGVKQ